MSTAEERWQWLKAAFESLVRGVGIWDDTGTITSTVQELMAYVSGTKPDGYPDMYYLVLLLEVDLEEGGTEPIGCAFRQVNSGSVTLHHLAIDRSWRRQGIATGLLQWLVSGLAAPAKPSGKTAQVVAGLVDNQPMQSLLEKLGFTPDEGPRHEGAAPPPEGYVRMVVNTKNLREHWDIDAPTGTVPRWAHSFTLVDGTVVVVRPLYIGRHPGLPASESEHYIVSVFATG